VKRAFLRAICAGLAALTLSLAACGPRAKAVDLPAPVQATTIGVGDVIEVQIVGEEKLPRLYTVASNGTVDLPYIKRVHVAGLEPEGLADLIAAKLIAGDILTNPDVSVSVKEYNSKRIEVLGEVQKPGSLPLQPGMTLLRAISLAGGFNGIANKVKVTILRKVNGKIRSATVSVQAIMDNEILDVPLQAGDSINVAQRIW
jgi:protein involved in polysaccharide export with SLBB domain